MEYIIDHAALFCISRDSVNILHVLCVLAFLVLLTVCITKVKHLKEQKKALEDELAKNIAGKAVLHEEDDFPEILTAQKE